jgi:hypothetical protein
LGYFDLFDSQFQLPLLILGPRGFGKSELFSLFIEQFNDDYIKFIPIASDGIIFQQDMRGNKLAFKTKGKYISIRGKDNVDWDRKIPVKTDFHKDYTIPIAEFNFGIMIVGSLGLEGHSRLEYKELVHERGHRLSFRSGVNLLRVDDPDQYTFELIRDMIEHPAHWKQLEVFRTGKLSRIDSEFRLIQKITEYLPKRILELTLPEEENKWGQLRDVFKAVVKKMDRLIISTVEYQLSTMIRRETSNLINQIHHEWRFPNDRQLPDLSGIPEIFLIDTWLIEKIKRHGPDLDLPPKVKQSIESGLLSIQTAFIEDLGSALKHINTAQELQRKLTIHSIAIGDMLTSLSQKTAESEEIITNATQSKEDIEALDDFLDAVMRGEI